MDTLTNIFIGIFLTSTVFWVVGFLWVEGLIFNNKEK